MRSSSALLLLALAAFGAHALAQSPKLPLQSDDKGTVYIDPNLSSTEKSVESKGATVGVQRPDGSAAYGGVDVSGSKPAYTAGATTGGNTSFSLGATTTDGKKDNTGVKAGVTIRY